MGNEREPPRWAPAPRGRRNAWFALALAAHALLVLTMLDARLPHERVAEPAVVEATLWLAPRPAPAPPATPPAPRPTRLRALRALPLPAADPQALRAPALAAQAIAQAASAPEPPASAASAPLDLTLTRAQLRAVIAGSRPSLAQSLARPPAPSALARIGGDDAPYEEIAQPGGETEVHVHGGCFRLVPTARSQYDPFNHGNERLTAHCR